MRHTTSNRRRSLCLERLEDRLAPATATWVGDLPTNNWSDGRSDTNWADDQVPGNKALVFDSSAVGHFTDNSDYPSLSVESLTCGAPGYTLSGNAVNLPPGGGILVFLAANCAVIHLDLNFDVSQG